MRQRKRKKHVSTFVSQFVKIMKKWKSENDSELSRQQDYYNLLE